MSSECTYQTIQMACYLSNICPKNKYERLLVNQWVDVSKTSLKRMHSEKIKQKCILVENEINFILLKSFQLEQIK